MTRILLLGDLAFTGFGTVTEDLGRALVERGEDVRFCSLNQRPGADLPEWMKARTALVGDAEGRSFDDLTDEQTRALAARLEGMFIGRLFDDGWTPEVGWVIGDVGSLESSPLLSFVPRGFPLYNYTPIEGIGSPPRWREFWAIAKPVAMCQFGADEIERVTGTRPPIVFHGVNPDGFWQVSAERPITIRTERELIVLRTKQDCKRLFHRDPKRVLLGRTDRNVPRKAYQSLLRSVMPVLARHPDVVLLLHCNVQDQGPNLLNELSKYGPLAPRVAITNMGGQLPRHYLNAFYNALDVYVTTSAEGFGLTIAEALMCGVPVIGLDYSSVPEVIGPAGVVVPVGALVDNIYSCFWAIPNEPAFGEALEPFVTDHFLRRRIGALGPAHVREHFDWKVSAAVVSDIVGVHAEREAIAV